MLSDQHFRQRLSCIEENLLTSIANGTLNSFQRSWTSLFNDFSKATSQLDPATVAIAHTVASNVFAITDCYSSMQCRQEELSTKLHDDWDRILGDASQTHNISPKESIPLTDHSPTISSNDSSLPTFVPLAYTWLLQNLHHPYPSLETKSSIAAKSNGSLSSIGAWFTSVRRRMGWTAICRNHFRNCRTDTLDAAYRALVKEDPERRLSSEITQAFMEMKVTTECLYSSIFTRSALANDLDGVVGDVATCSMSTPLQAKESPDKLGPTSGSGMHQASYRYLSSKRDTSIQRSELYPERSWSPSSVTSSLNNDEYSDEAIDDEATSVTPARNKRRLSTSDLLDGVQYKDSCRPIKRLRPLHHNEATFTPSFEVRSSVESNADSFAHTRATPRKRRLSNAGIPHRPCGFPTAPRTYTASDPLPIPSAHKPDIDAWFETSFSTLFDLPPPADSEDFDQSTPWEIEFFKDYSIPQERVSSTVDFSPSQPSFLPDGLSSRAAPTITELSGLDQIVDDSEQYTSGHPFPARDYHLGYSHSNPPQISITTASNPFDPDSWAQLLGSDLFNPGPVESFESLEMALSGYATTLCQG